MAALVIVGATSAGASPSPVAVTPKAATTPPPATPPPATSSVAAEVCAHRPDVVALRLATSTTRAVLLAKLAARHDAATGRSQACLAAVLAEGWRLEAKLDDAGKLLDVAAAGLPEIARELTTARKALQNAPAEDESDPVAARCLRGVDSACLTLLTSKAWHPVARQVEGAWQKKFLTSTAAVMGQRVRALVAAARPLHARDEAAAWRTAHPESTADDRSVMDVAAGEGLLRLEDPAAALAVALPYRVDVDGVLKSFDVERARLAAKASSRLGKVDDAARIWRDLATTPGDWPGSTETKRQSEGAFFAAFSLLEVGRDQEALAAFVAAKTKTTTSPWQDQRDWYEALLLLTGDKGGAINAAGALPLLERLIKVNDRETLKYRYWRSVALRLVNRPADAAAEEARVIAADPLDYYAILIRQERGVPLEGAAVASDALVDVDDATTKRARLLYDLGLDDDAWKVCADQGRRKPSLRALSVCHAVDAAHPGWRYGGYFTPRPALVPAHEGQHQSLAPSERWRVSYARPWAGVVDENARVAGIRPSFVMAIMRTESGFDPRALSAAGAQGAVQLLPTVARRAAKLMELDPAWSERLFEPEVAVTVGSRLLGLLVREHGSILLAAAAYNAGPAPAVTWAQRFGKLPFAVFVERIPYRETRDYVKRVLAVEAVYAGLEGEAVHFQQTNIRAAVKPTIFPYLE